MAYIKRVVPYTINKKIIGNNMAKEWPVYQKVLKINVPTTTKSTNVNGRAQFEYFVVDPNGKEISLGTDEVWFVNL